MLGEISERTLKERMMKITDKSVSDEPRGFWKGRGCLDQIFAVKILVAKYLEDRKLFSAFMDFEKAYDIVDSKGLWDTSEFMGWEMDCLRGSCPSMIMQVPLCGGMES